MERLSMYYYSFFCFIFFLCHVPLLSAQGNCLVFDKDSGERIACELSYRALEYGQGDKESQLLFDHAIRIGPKYAWAYYEKSVPFFKRGLFAEGVSLINKAIELEPQNYLYYRAYWYFYNRSYAFCIKDLEALYSTYKAPYTTTPGGELEMRLILAMAYAQTGNVSRGIQWAERLMESYKGQLHLKGFYDHFCLGVLYYKNNQLDLALAEFEKQLIVNDSFADTYYYMGLIQDELSKSTLSENYFKQALAKIEGEDGGYSANIFEAYNINKEDIEKKLYH